MSFAGILNTIDNGQLTDELKVIQDGMGNNSPLSLSKTDFKINTTMGSFFINNTELEASADELNAASVGDFSGFSDSILPAIGDTSQRPVIAENGEFRYNSQTNRFEGYQDGAWVIFTTTPA
jgi:hypothetical protein